MKRKDASRMQTRHFCKFWGSRSVSKSLGAEKYGQGGCDLSLTILKISEINELHCFLLLDFGIRGKFYRRYKKKLKMKGPLCEGLVDIVRNLA